MGFDLKTAIQTIQGFGEVKKEKDPYKPHREQSRLMLDSIRESRAQLGFDEQRRQYEQSFNEDQRQYEQTFKEDKRQFDKEDFRSRFDLGLEAIRDAESRMASSRNPSAADKFRYAGGLSHIQAMGGQAARGAAIGPKGSAAKGGLTASQRSELVPSGYGHIQLGMGGADKTQQIMYALESRGFNMAQNDDGFIDPKTEAEFRKIMAAGSLPADDLPDEQRMRVRRLRQMQQEARRGASPVAAQRPGVELLEETYQQLVEAGFAPPDETGEIRQSVFRDPNLQRQLDALQFDYEVPPEVKPSPMAKPQQEEEFSDDQEEEFSDDAGGMADDDIPPEKPGATDPAITPKKKRLEYKDSPKWDKAKAAMPSTRRPRKASLGDIGANLFHLMRGVVQNLPPVRLLKPAYDEFFHGGADGAKDAGILNRNPDVEASYGPAARAHMALRPDYYEDGSELDFARNAADMVAALNPLDSAFRYGLSKAVGDETEASNRASILGEQARGVGQFLTRLPAETYIGSMVDIAKPVEAIAETVTRHLSGIDPETDSLLADSIEAAARSLFEPDDPAWAKVNEQFRFGTRGDKGRAKNAVVAVMSALGAGTPYADIEKIDRFIEKTGLSHFTATPSEYLARASDPVGGLVDVKGMADFLRTRAPAAAPATPGAPPPASGRGSAGAAAAAHAAAHAQAGAQPTPSARVKRAAQVGSQHLAQNAAANRGLGGPQFAASADPDPLGAYPTVAPQQATRPPGGVIGGRQRAGSPQNHLRGDQMRGRGDVNPPQPTPNPALVVGSPEFIARVAREVEEMIASGRDSGPGYEDRIDILSDAGHPLAASIAASEAPPVPPSRSIPGTLSPRQQLKDLHGETYTSSEIARARREAQRRLADDPDAPMSLSETTPHRRRQERDMEVYDQNRVNRQRDRIAGPEGPSEADVQAVRDAIRRGVEPEPRALARVSRSLAPEHQVIYREYVAASRDLSESRRPTPAPMEEMYAADESSPRNLGRAEASPALPSAEHLVGRGPRSAPDGPATRRNREYRGEGPQDAAIAPRRQAPTETPRQAETAAPERVSEVFSEIEMEFGPRDPGDGAVGPRMSRGFDDTTFYEGKVDESPDPVGFTSKRPSIAPESPRADLSPEDAPIRSVFQELNRAGIGTDEMMALRELYKWLETVAKTPEEATSRFLGMLQKAEGLEGGSRGATPPSRYPHLYGRGAAKVAKKILQNFQAKGFGGDLEYLKQRYQSPEIKQLSEEALAAERFKAGRSGVSVRETKQAMDQFQRDRRLAAEQGNQNTGYDATIYGERSEGMTYQSLTNKFRDLKESGGGTIAALIPEGDFFSAEEFARIEDPVRSEMMEMLEWDPEAVRQVAEEGNLGGEGGRWGHAQEAAELLLQAHQKKARRDGVVAKRSAEARDAALKPKVPEAQRYNKSAKQQQLDEIRKRKAPERPKPAVEPQSPEVQDHLNAAEKWTSAGAFIKYLEGKRVSKNFPKGSPRSAEQMKAVERRFSQKFRPAWKKWKDGGGRPLVGGEAAPVRSPRHRKATLAEADKTSSRLSRLHELSTKDLRQIVTGGLEKMNGEKITRAERIRAHEILTERALEMESNALPSPGYRRDISVFEPIFDYLDRVFPDYDIVGPMQDINLKMGQANKVIDEFKAAANKSWLRYDPEVRQVAADINDAANIKRRALEKQAGMWQLDPNGKKKLSPAGQQALDAHMEGFVSALSPEKQAFWGEYEKWTKGVVESLNRGRAPADQVPFRKWYMTYRPRTPQFWTNTEYIDHLADVNYHRTKSQQSATYPRERDPGVLMDGYLRQMVRRDLGISSDLNALASKLESMPLPPHSRAAVELFIDQYRHTHKTLHTDSGAVIARKLAYFGVKLAGGDPTTLRTLTEKTIPNLAQEIWKLNDDFRKAKGKSQKAQIGKQLGQKFEEYRKAKQELVTEMDKHPGVRAVYQTIGHSPMLDLVRSIQHSKIVSALGMRWARYTAAQAGDIIDATLGTKGASLGDMWEGGKEVLKKAPEKIVQQVYDSFASKDPDGHIRSAEETIDLLRKGFQGKRLTPGSQFPPVSEAVAKFLIKHSEMTAGEIARGRKYRGRARGREFARGAYDSASKVLLAPFELGDPMMATYRMHTADATFQRVFNKLVSPDGKLRKVQEMMGELGDFYRDDTGRARKLRSLLSNGDYVEARNRYVQDLAEKAVVGTWASHRAPLYLFANTKPMNEVARGMMIMATMFTSHAMARYSQAHYKGGIDFSILPGLEALSDASAAKRLGFAGARQLGAATLSAGFALAVSSLISAALSEDEEDWRKVGWRGFVYGMGGFGIQESPGIGFLEDTLMGGRSGSGPGGKIMSAAKSAWGGEYGKAARKLATIEEAPAGIGPAMKMGRLASDAVSRGRYLPREATAVAGVRKKGSKKKRRKGRRGVIAPRMRY